MKQRVRIELHSTIDDQGQKEFATVKESGSFYQKEPIDVLTFNETVEEHGTVNNLITIQMNKVNIKRSGGVAMNQQFRLKHTTENVFQHPFGSIHMETFTNSIQYQPLASDQHGYLKLDYTVKLNGQDERKHILELTFTEEDV